MPEKIAPKPEVKPDEIKPEVKPVKRVLKAIESLFQTIEEEVHFVTPTELPDTGADVE